MWFPHNFALPSTALALVLAAAPLAVAQVRSNAGTIQMTASLNESLTVTVNRGAVVNFNLVQNTPVNSGSASTQIRSAWQLGRGRASIAVWAYFTSSTAALAHQTAGNPTDIPSAAVKIRDGRRGSFLPLNAVSPFNPAASGVQIGAPIAITAANRIGALRYQLFYQIDTTVVPALRADTYVGILHIQAEATP
jgi:hypothetical protein